MKNIVTYAVNLLSCILLIIGIFSCLISSFEITANLFVVEVCTALFSCVYGLLAVFIKNKKIFFISICVSALVFVLTLIFSFNNFLAELSFVLTKIFSEYSLYLPVPATIAIGTKSVTSATAFFVFLSAVFSGLFTVSFIRYKKLFLIIPLSVLSLIPCFLLVNTLPALGPLIMLVTILLALYITSGLRRHNASQSGAVTLLAAVITGIMLAVILMFNPVKDFKRFEWQEAMRKNLPNITMQGDGEKSAEIPPELEKEQDLNNVQSTVKTHDKVMDVSSDNESGLLYLKGVAYADYNNNKWQILTDSQLNLYPKSINAFTITQSALSNTDILSKVSVKTVGSEPVFYTPSFITDVPDNMNVIADVCISNDKEQKSYEFMHYKTTSNMFGLYLVSSQKYTEFVYDTYLQLPNKTRTDLYNIAINNNLTELDEKEIPNAVKSFVSSSAEYSLNVNALPNGKDFPVWFLNECDTGYCVHYATAATLMLRTLGIPARYVTGYYANLSGENTASITTDNAHAWVEYFDKDIGWVTLECTPSSFISEQTPSATENQTIAPSTQAPTDSTQATTAPSKDRKNNNTVTSTAFIVGLLICVLIVLAVTAIIFRRNMILNRRKRQMQDANNNETVILLYRRLVRLSNHSHLVIDNNITSIFDKAKFSKHTITDEEVQTVRRYIDNSFEELFKNLSPIKKLYYRFIAIL